MNRFLMAMVFLGLAVVPSTSQAQQVNTADDATSWGGARVADTPWFTQGWGQVFTVPTAETFLNSFSFWMRDQSGYGDSQFRAHLATWDDATKSVGEIWASPERGVTSPTTSSGWVPTTLANYAEQAFTPGQRLTAGATYIAYLEVSSFDASDPLAFRGDWVAIREVAGGGAVYFQDGVVTPFDQEGDLAFTATFSAVPEPSAVFLLATGLIGIGGMGWARRRKNG